MHKLAAAGWKWVRIKTEERRDEAKYSVVLQEVARNWSLWL